MKKYTKFLLATPLVALPAISFISCSESGNSFSTKYLKLEGKDKWITFEGEDKFTLDLSKAEDADKIKSIPKLAFAENKIIFEPATDGNTKGKTRYLSKVILPENLERIEEGAFLTHSSFLRRDLVKVDFSKVKNLKFIGQKAFQGNDISQLSLPSTVEIIEDFSFQKNAISELKISNLTSLTRIGIGAFGFNEISLLELPVAKENLVYSQAAFEYNKISAKPNNWKEDNQYSYDEVFYNQK